MSYEFYLPNEDPNSGESYQAYKCATFRRGQITSSESKIEENRLRTRNNEEFNEFETHYSMDTQAPLFRHNEARVRTNGNFVMMSKDRSRSSFGNYGVRFDDQPYDDCRKNRRVSDHFFIHNYPYTYHLCFCS